MAVMLAPQSIVDNNRRYLADFFHMFIMTTSNDQGFARTIQSLTRAVLNFFTQTKHILRSL
jgi:hypothetical protein